MTEENTNNIQKTHKVKIKIFNPYNLNNFLYNLHYIQRKNNNLKLLNSLFVFFINLWVELININDGISFMRFLEFINEKISKTVKNQKEFLRLQQKFNFFLINVKNRFSGDLYLTKDLDVFIKYNQYFSMIQFIVIVICIFVVLFLLSIWIIQKIKEFLK